MSGKAVRALLERLGRDRRAAVADPGERRQRPRTRELLLAQGGQHRRHQQRVGDAVLGDQVERGGGVERGQDDLVAAVPDGRHHRDRAGRVGQGRRHQPARVRPEWPDELEVGGVRGEVAVRQHHALGRSGRAAGVEQAGEVVLVRLGELACGRAFDQRLVPGSEIDHVLDARGHVGQLDSREHHPRAGVLERVMELRSGVARIQRHDHHPGAGHALVELQVPVAVRPDDRHPVPGAEPKPCQRTAQPAAAVGHLGVRQARPPAGHRTPIARHALRAAERRNHRWHLVSSPLRGSDSSPWKYLTAEVAGVARRLWSPSRRARAQPTLGVSATYVVLEALGVTTVAVALA